MIDFDRTSDTELLRTAAKILDAEVLRLHKKIEDMTRALAEAQGLGDEERQQRLIELHEQLASAYKSAWDSGGSERRPNPNKPKKDRAPQKGHGPTKQAELPIQEVPGTLDEADRTCPECGRRLEEWLGQFDRRDRIAVEKAAYRVLRHILQKYRCRCGHIETAPAPEQLVKGGRYDNSFAVQVFENKYGSLIPRSRQVKIMRRAGLDITAQAIWDQELSLINVLLPVKQRLHRFLLEQEVLLADETRWPLLGSPAHSTKNYYIWSGVAPPGVVYEFLDSRANESGRHLLEGFKGTVLSDGYVVYTSLAKELGFTQAADWTHVRRKFIEAEEVSPEQAQPFIQKIGDLFMVERKIKEQVADLDSAGSRNRTVEIRQSESKPLVAEIGQMAAEVRALKSSRIAKAITYLENRWPALQTFLENGAVPITSNEVEQMLRAPVMGRSLCVTL